MHVHVCVSVGTYVSHINFYFLHVYVDSRYLILKFKPNVTSRGKKKKSYLNFLFVWLTSI